MFTKPLPIVELKQIFLEALLNTTNRVTKINDHSVLSGIGFGIAKVAQKAMKDIALVESHKFINSASGSDLDSYASDNGIAPRFEASASSTYVRLVGSVGTLYEQGINICTGSHGINFEFDEDVVIGIHGYAYTRVRSTTIGLQTNVDALSINKINPIPTGHNYILNEVQAIGGRDIESDDLFRKRIKESINIAATDTISHLEQVFMKINPDILRVFYQGVNDNGKHILSLTTQNGIGLTAEELSDLEDKVAQYLSVTDLSPYGYGSIGIQLQNSLWEYVDIDFRGELEEGIDANEIRKDIQIKITKYLDHRFWDANKKVEWDDLLTIVRTTKGMRSVSDTTFYPHTDITVPYTKLPRLRSFIMRDLNGSILTDVSGFINPVYYPNEIDLSYQRTVLSTI